MKVQSDNSSRYDFWLSLYGDNINFSKIEDLLQIKMSSADRITAPVLTMKSSESTVNYDEIAWLLDLVESKKDELTNLGVCFAESQVWMLYCYEEQCNIEFDAEILQRMGNLGLKLCVSCFQDD